MWLRRTLYGVVLIFVATGLVRWGVWFAYIRPTVPKGSVGEIQFETRVDQPSRGEKREYEIGVFFVPENRSNPNSRVIAIDYARYPAKEKKGPPIFVLPGGPGESHIGKIPDPVEDTLL